MGNLFKPKKESIDYKTLETPGAQAGQSYLSQQLTKPYQPYSGERVAPLSGPEQAGQSALTSYIGRPEQPLYGEAQSELSKTLTGQYDPSTSPFYQATRQAAGREAETAIRGVRQGAQLGGGLYGSAREQTEGQVRSDLATELTKLLGGMAETERGRRSAAVPQAFQAGQFLEEAPLRTAEAATTYGAAPRQIAQAGLDTDYEAYLREQQFPFQLSQIAQALLSYQPTYMPAAQYGPSPFQQIAEPAGRVVGGLAGGGYL